MMLNCNKLSSDIVCTVCVKLNVLLIFFGLASAVGSHQFTEQYGVFLVKIAHGQTPVDVAPPDLVLKKAKKRTQHLPPHLQPRVPPQFLKRALLNQPSIAKPHHTKHLPAPFTIKLVAKTQFDPIKKHQTFSLSIVRTHPNEIPIFIDFDLPKSVVFDSGFIHKIIDLTHHTIERDFTLSITEAQQKLTDPVEVHVSIRTANFGAAAHATVFFTP